jgi:hypothetical protein
MKSSENSQLSRMEFRHHISCHARNDFRIGRTWLGLFCG